MEDWQEQHDSLKGEVTQLSGKLDQVLKMLTSLGQPAQPVTTEVPIPVVVVPSRSSSTSNKVRPPHGLPVGYAPLEAMPSSTKGPANARVVQVLVSNNVETPASHSRTPPVQLGHAIERPKPHLGIRRTQMNHQVVSQKGKEVNGGQVKFTHTPHAVTQHQQPQGYPPQIPVQQQMRKDIDPIPITYGQLLLYLLHHGMVTPRALKPMIAPFPAWYDPKAKCEFHYGAEGHNVENCRAFKKKVQELIDQQLLTFKKGSLLGKDVLLPKCSEPRENKVEKFDELTRDVPKTYLTREAMIYNDQCSSLYPECEFCKEDPNHCTKVKSLLRKSVEQGLLQKDFLKNGLTSHLIGAQPQGYPYPHAVQVPVPQQIREKASRDKKVFDPIPIPYRELFPYLVSNNMVVPVASLPRTAPYPAWYNPKAKCAYHAGAEGHSTDNCKTFKNKVQELIDKKLLIFKEKGPNVKDNLLPGHASSYVGAS